MVNPTDNMLVRVCLDKTDDSGKLMLTQAELKKHLVYDPETGIFTRIKSGAVAGSSHTRGYSRIHICGAQHLSHRLAFLYMTGAWPPEHVDHINHAHDDNRWVNLRAASRAQNQANRLANKNSRTGVKGVTPCGPSFRAMIRIKNKRHNLGSFATVEAAAEAYRKELMRVAGQFAFSGRPE